MLFKVPRATPSLGLPATVTDRPGRMLELALAPAGGYQVLAIFMQQAEHLGNLHFKRIAGRRLSNKPSPELAV
jgi:hypothetical protein